MAISAILRAGAGRAGRGRLLDPSLPRNQKPDRGAGLSYGDRMSKGVQHQISLYNLNGGMGFQPMCAAHCEKHRTIADFIPFHIANMG